MYPPSHSFPWKPPGLLETGGKRRRESPRRGQARPCPLPPLSPLSSTGPAHGTAPPAAWVLPQPQGCSTSLSRHYHLSNPTAPSAGSAPASRHDTRHNTPTSGRSTLTSGCTRQRVTFSGTQGPRGAGLAGHSGSCSPQASSAPPLQRRQDYTSRSAGRGMAADGGVGES